MNDPEWEEGLALAESLNSSQKPKKMQEYDESLFTLIEEIESEHELGASKGSLNYTPQSF
jgi:hypothetical protein